MKSMILSKTFLIFILFSFSNFSSNSQSLFDSLNSNNAPNHQEKPKIQMNRSGPNKFQTIVENLKSKISNPQLRQNFTAENVAGLFETLLTGNEFLKNIDVNELALFDKLEINDLLKLKETAQFEEITVKSSFKNNILNITDDNEVIFEDEAVIRIKNSPIAFKAKDIFEVIAFLKFMMKICGKQMEKCDFNTLLKNSLNQQKLDLMKVLKERFNKNKEEFAKINSDYKNLFDKKEEREKIASDERKKKNLKSNSKGDTSEGVDSGDDTNQGKVLNTNNFNFKEKNENVNKNNTNYDEKNEAKHKVDKEIEELLDYEYKFFKENSSVNDFENFYNNGLYQKYLAKYYYEGI